MSSTRNTRIRVALLLVAFLVVGGIIVVSRVNKDEDLPVSGPIPPSSVPPTSADLAQLQFRLTPVATVENPTAFAIRAGDSSFYVAEQEGRVRRIRRDGDGFALEDQPVLDITSDVTPGGERGLLGLAFSPDGRTMFMAYTNKATNQQLDEVSFNGDSVDPSTRRELLVIPDFAPNHNGGGLITGPDGFLYWGMGDGGGAGDPRQSGQNPGDLLGNIIRIDPSRDGPDGRPYAIPADNPFAGGGGAPEVWMYGLRNPWRFSFDRTTRDLWIGDVGQNAIEEIDFLAAGTAAGQNFGWSDVEGTHPYRAPQPPAGAVAPIYEYDHAGSRCSVTGGYIYRGDAIPALQGTYLFADYCDGLIHGLVRAADGSVTVTDLRIAAGGLTSFGEDADGELYVLSRQGGVQRIDAAAPAGQSTPEQPASGALAPPSLPSALSSDPATAADQLVAAERALRDPASSSQTLDAAAHLQQVAYRKLGRQPELDEMILAKAGPELRDIVAANLGARHELAAIPGPPLRDTLPAWRIIQPAPSDELLGYYKEAEAQFGVGWNYLAAINLIETAMGRIQGLSSAGAQGPMQFIPSTWAAFGEGDINSPHDSILAAARYLAHNGFAEGNIDGALFNYNRSEHYVNAIKAIASVLAADEHALAGYYRWEVFYVTTVGDVHLPVGYETPEPISAADYVATHPQE
jgi:glucose/arabinose dehydrogenase/soluble lytic murein transglycosylase-like protein